MRTNTLSVSVLALVPWLSCLVCGAVNAAALPDAIERVKPSIVGVGTVQHTRRPPSEFRGTGFVVGDGRHVIGIVSAITPIVIPQISAGQLTPEMVKRLKEPYDIFQLDATAYPGNSGSPLYFPGTGVVVGVINKVFVKESKENLLKDPSGITYAIPATYAEALMNQAGIKAR